MQPKLLTMLSKNLKVLVLIFFSCALLDASCKKKSAVGPVDQLSLLPPATQTGAGTFGCLINGQAFVPSGEFLSGTKITSNVYGSNQLDVFAINKSDNGNVSAFITIQLQGLQIIQGVNYPLALVGQGNGNAIYDIGSYGTDNTFNTTNAVQGNLTITRFDTAKQILSGTFNFKAISSKGDTVKVTDGRFDVIFL